MKKNELLIGFAVAYDRSSPTLVSPIIQIAEDFVILANGMSAKFDELYAPNDPTWRKYNRTISEVHSKYNSRFNKNDDKEIYKNGDHIWFTSDTHFCHENIIKFCGRPFATVEEMNKALVEKWNSIVGPDDIVYHLGDFCWGGSSNWVWILEHLNGHIHLVLGNHDVKNIRQGYMQYFDSVTFQRQIEIEGRAVYLNHYPFLTYGGIYRKDSEKVWQLFGHVHSKDGSGGADAGRLKFKLPTQYDVGVDNNNYGPISWEIIKQKISEQFELTGGRMISLVDLDIEELKHSLSDLRAQFDALMAFITPEQRKAFNDEFNQKLNDMYAVTPRAPQLQKEPEHIALENEILKNLLTPEQKKQFEEMTIDKPETQLGPTGEVDHESNTTQANIQKTNEECARDFIINILWQENEWGGYIHDRWMPMDQYDSFIKKPLGVFGFDSLDMAEIAMTIEKAFDYKFDRYQSEHMFYDNESVEHFASRIARMVIYCR